MFSDTEKNDYIAALAVYYLCAIVELITIKVAELEIRNWIERKKLNSTEKSMKWKWANQEKCQIQKRV